MKNKHSITAFLLLGGFVGVMAQTTMQVQGTVYEVDTLRHIQVGPGSTYTSMQLIGDPEVRVHYLTIDRSNPYIEFNGLMGCDSVLRTERISSLAVRHSKPQHVYFAGTNGDFFNTSGPVGESIMSSIHEGEVGKSSTSIRPWVAFDQMMQPGISPVKYSGVLKGEQGNYPIAKVNGSRGTDQIIFYNNYTGHYTKTNNSGTELLVELVEGEHWQVNGDFKVRVKAIYLNQPGCFIPENHAVISAHGAGRDFVSQYAIGDDITLNLSFTSSKDGATPDIATAIGGDRQILDNGVVCDNDWAERHPRTSFGYDKAGSKVVFCIVDGRCAHSAGVTTKQLADINKYAGVTEAINLDGGGSSGMYVKDMGIMSYSSDGSERAVANGLFAISTAPDDEQIAQIEAEKPHVIAPHCGVIEPSFLGYNQYGTLLTDALEGVKLTCEPKLGTVNEQGLVVADGGSSGFVTATYQGAETRIFVEIKPSEAVSVRLDSVYVDQREAYPIEVESLIDGEKYAIDPSHVVWEVADPSICEIKDGCIHALKNGDTEVTGTFGDISDKIKVCVRTPEAAQIHADDFTQPTSWTVDGSASLKDLQLIDKGNGKAAISFTYSAGRALNFTVNKPLKLYGLPDSITMKVNPQAVNLSKAYISISAADEDKSVIIEKTDVSQNTESVFSIKPADIVENPADRIHYPLEFENMKFYLAASGHTTGTAYEVLLYDFMLHYKSFSVGMENTYVNNSLQLYPNPASGDEVVITTTGDQPIESLRLYTLQGDLVQAYDCQESNMTTTLPIGDLAAGIYVLHVELDNRYESIRLIKH